MFNRVLVNATGKYEYIVPEFIPGNNSLWVFVNGKKEFVDDDYIETSSTTIKFLKHIPRGELIEFLSYNGSGD